MPTGYTADLDRMRDGVVRMAKFDTALEAHLEKLDRRVARRHTSWTGDAALAQRHAHAELMRAAENMRHALATMRSIAETAHGNYHATVSANVRMWDDVLILGIGAVPVDREPHIARHSRCPDGRQG